MTQHSSSQATTEANYVWVQTSLTNGLSSLELSNDPREEPDCCLGFPSYSVNVELNVETAGVLNSHIIAHLSAFRVQQHGDQEMNNDGEKYHCIKNS